MRGAARRGAARCRPSRLSLAPFTGRVSDINKRRPWYEFQIPNSKFKILDYAAPQLRPLEHTVRNGFIDPDAFHRVGHVGARRGKAHAEGYFHALHVPVVVEE